MYGRQPKRDCLADTLFGQSPSRVSPYYLMWSVSDDALIAGLATGDQDAASAFVRRFQRRVFGLARTIVSDDRAAEDIAQEAFVRAWRHAGAFDPRRGTVVSWLLAITRNLAIDSIRVKRPLAFDPVALLELDRPSADATCPTWPCWPTTLSGCGSRSPGCPRTSVGRSCSRVYWATPRAR